jgi:hypothetical protein
MSKRADRRRRERRGSRSPGTGTGARPPVPAHDDAGGVNARLTRLLDTPHLAHVVPRLSPEVLHHLIRDRGLDACGALIAASTPQQVAALLDLDLWRTTPGRDDQFDGRRFGSWLEMLMDAGERVAARVVAAVDQTLAIAGLSRHVRVFDPGVLPSVASSDDGLEGLDVATSGSLECEVGGYVVRARTAHAWDAIVGLLVTLADDRPDSFHALMQGCRRLSNSTPEADGFHELMLEPEQLLHDVSLEREHRRLQQGYLTAGDARAFLQMARQPRPPRPNGSSSINAIAAAYFRALDDSEGSASASAGAEELSARSSTDPKMSESIDAVVDLLGEAGIASARPRAMLGPVPADVARVTPIQPLMEYVHDTDQVAYFARSRELAFLANSLLGGCSVYSRPFTAQEAWDAAVGICNLGLEVGPARWLETAVDAARESDLTTTLPSTFLVDHDVVTAFEAGWRLLHEDVSMFVAERLIATLADLRSVESESQRDLYLLRRELERNRDAGTPWFTREVALDVIAILDMPTWACVRGLLSECPVLPAALTAIIEGHSRSVSATAFACFTTSGQIRKVHEFAARLRDLLLH